MTTKKKSLQLVNNLQDGMRLLLLTGAFLPSPSLTVASPHMTIARGKHASIIFRHKNNLSFSSSMILLSDESVLGPGTRHSVVSATLPPIPFLVLLFR